VWRDISSKQTTVAILLEQTGGYCEPRTNVNRPTPRFRYDAGHTVFIPADMAIWGYSDSIKTTRDLRLHFDLDMLPTILGEDLNYSKATAPVLMLYDERVTRCVACRRMYQQSPRESYVWREHHNGANGGAVRFS
jgi:AraC family transcriptional regulator